MPSRTPRRALLHALRRSLRDHRPRAARFRQTAQTPRSPANKSQRPRGSLLRAAVYCWVTEVRVQCSAGFTTTTGEPHDAPTASVATTGPDVLLKLRLPSQRAQRVGCQQHARRAARKGTRSRRCSRCSCRRCPICESIVQNAHHHQGGVSILRSGRLRTLPRRSHHGSYDSAIRSLHECRPLWDAPTGARSMKDRRRAPQSTE